MNDKKFYEVPTIRLEAVMNEDIISTSGGPLSDGGVDEGRASSSFADLFGSND